MKIKNDNTYYIRSSNMHLINILEDDYYIELGAIDMKMMNKIIKGEKVNLQELMNFEILSEGSGMITGDILFDYYYQLNYLINLRLKNSSYKFLLTAGVIKYYDQSSCEKYAPLVLIPFDFDYQSFEIVASSTPMINTKIIKELAVLYFRDIEKDKTNPIDYLRKSKYKIIGGNETDYQKRFYDEYVSRKIYSVQDIDKLCLDLGEVLHTTVNPTNYLTIGNVEYGDILIGQDFMTTERSIFETTEEKIVNHYFTNIKSILPTNLDQKYVLLKVDKGEKFAIDGRIGSGKTHTILNILSDQVLKGKKILYINQDLDNLFDLEKSISYLGFDGLSYNLTRNLRRIERPEVDIENKGKSDLSLDILVQLFNHLNHLQTKIHGYTIQHIFEELAILKKENSSIEPIQLEITLEKHEVQRIYHDLLEIEDALKMIDTYATNVWHRLQIYRNNITKEGIIKRLEELQEINIELYQKEKKTMAKYGIKPASTIHELYKTISHVYHFASVRPLPEWIDEKTRRETLKALREIQGLVDIKYNLSKYYEATTIDTYIPGRMEKILKVILADHLNVEENWETTDAIFINRLIQFDEKLVLLTKDMEQNVNQTTELVSKLKTIFGLKEITDTCYRFFTQLDQFLNQHLLNPLVIDCYLEQPMIFSKYAQPITDAYLLYLEEVIFLPRFITHFEQLTKGFLDIELHKKNQDRFVMHYINRKIAKKEKQDVKVIVEHVKKYYHTMEVLQDAVQEVFGKKELDIELVEQFVKFNQFVTTLDHQFIFAWKKLLHEYKKGRYQDHYIQVIHQLLTQIKSEGYQTSSICTSLRNYNIHIVDGSILDKVEKIKLWQLYLKEVIELKQEIKGIFIQKDTVTYDDIVILIENDRMQQQLQKDLETNAPRYKKNLGKYYRGLDTIIGDIGQTIEHYDDFLKKISPNCDINALFEDQHFNHLLEDIKEIDVMYAQWVSAFRAFSVCFKGSQNDFQSNSFDANIKIFKTYLNKVDQIDAILTINVLTERFLNYHLDDLYEGIRSCKYGLGISKRFMYSVFLDYYRTIESQYPELLSSQSLLQYLNDYQDFEYAYCQKNGFELKKKVEDIRKKVNLNHGYAFNDYNHIVNALSKSIPVFLSDLDILNSHLDISVFDLVIVDDAHLSTSNKYYRIQECKQVIIFGDKLFQTSVSNALMQRLGKACTVDYKRRYIQMNSKFNNIWSYNNQYIYAYDNQCDIIQVDHFEAFIEHILNRFYMNPSHIINVLVANESTRRKAYTSIVKGLVNAYSPEEIGNILCYHIRILNALTEGNRYVNDVYIYYDDFRDLEASEKELVFKNFIAVYNSVQVFYLKHRLESENEMILKSIQQTIGKNVMQEKKPEGITQLLIQSLRDKKIKAEGGFGSFDIIIKRKKPFAIMIMGKSEDYTTTFVDDYIYYHQEYKKRGWQVEVVYIHDLYIHYDQVVSHIIQQLALEKKG